MQPASGALCHFPTTNEALWSNADGKHPNTWLVVDGTLSEFERACDVAKIKSFHGEFSRWSGLPFALAYTVLLWIALAYVRVRCC